MQELTSRSPSECECGPQLSDFFGSCLQLVCRNQTRVFPVASKACPCGSDTLGFASHELLSMWPNGVGLVNAVAAAEGDKSVTEAEDMILSSLSPYALFFPTCWVFCHCLGSC
jgi:hypothetical protein